MDREHGEISPQEFDAEDYHCRLHLYHWTVNPAFDSGPTHYLVMATDTEAARTLVLVKCRPEHRKLVCEYGPLVRLAGDVVTI